MPTVSASPLQCRVSRGCRIPQAGPHWGQQCPLARPHSPVFPLFSLPAPPRGEVTVSCTEGGGLSWGRKGRRRAGRHPSLHAQACATLRPCLPQNCCGTPSPHPCRVWRATLRGGPHPRRPPSTESGTIRRHGPLQPAVSHTGKHHTYDYFSLLRARQEGPAVAPKSR